MYPSHFIFRFILKNLPSIKKSHHLRIQGQILTKIHMGHNISVQKFSKSKCAVLHIILFGQNFLVRLIPMT